MYCVIGITASGDMDGIVLLCHLIFGYPHFCESQGTELHFCVCFSLALL